jgi:hypothetical protein
MKQTEMRYIVRDFTLKQTKEVLAALTTKDSDVTITTIEFHGQFYDIYHELLDAITEGKTVIRLVCFFCVPNSALWNNLKRLVCSKESNLVYLDLSGIKGVVSPDFTLLPLEYGDLGYSTRRSSDLTWMCYSPFSSLNMAINLKVEDTKRWMYACVNRGVLRNMLALLSVMLFPQAPIKKLPLEHFKLLLTYFGMKKPFS